MSGPRKLRSRGRSRRKIPNSVRLCPCTPPPPAPPTPDCQEGKPLLTKNKSNESGLPARAGQEVRSSKSSHIARPLCQKKKEPRWINDTNEAVVHFFHPFCRFLPRKPKRVRPPTVSSPQGETSQKKGQRSVSVVQNSQEQIRKKATRVENN